MFAESKDEISIVLVGTPDTDNPLADGTSYENITIAHPMSVADFDMLQFVQNDVQPSNISGDCILTPAHLLLLTPIHLLLTLNVPISTKGVCFSPLLKCLRCLYSKQCGPRLDCSHRSSLFWVNAVCFYA